MERNYSIFFVAYQGLLSKTTNIPDRIVGNRIRNQLGLRECDTGVVAPTLNALFPVRTDAWSLTCGNTGPAPLLDGPDMFPCQ
jgi:hypothetical protein